MVRPFLVTRTLQHRTFIVSRVGDKGREGLFGRKHGGAVVAQREGLDQAAVADLPALRGGGLDLRFGADLNQAVVNPAQCGERAEGRDYLRV